MRAWAGRRRNACCGTPMRRWARRPDVWPRAVPVCQACVTSVAALPRICGTCCWPSTGVGGREMAAEAIDLDRCSDILELFPAEPLQPIALSQASSRLWSDEDLTGFGHICQTGHQVGN